MRLSGFAVLAACVLGTALCAVWAGWALGTWLGAVAW